MEAATWMRIAPLAAASCLAACGGGSSGSDSNPANNPPAPIATVPNRAPQISGSPATVAQFGQPYSFRPTAQDADGDPLSFSIQNRPAWATFDSSNGTLNGTPACTDDGTNTNIVISASDGRATTALPGFSITVGTPSVTVSWVPPTTDVHGTSIEGLDGFVVYYGTASGQYSRFVGVSDPHVTTVCVDALSAGITWYFAVTAISSSGVESSYSLEASKTLP